MGSRGEYASDPFRLFDGELGPEVCYSLLGWRQWFSLGRATATRKCGRVAHIWERSNYKSLSMSARKRVDLKSIIDEYRQAGKSRIL